MKGWTQTTYGIEDVLTLRDDLSTPQRKDDQVLVKVHAVGLNAADVHMMTGIPVMVRAATGVRRPRVPVLGADFAGVVVGVGEKVTHVQVGDAVMGEPLRGSLSECVAVPGKYVARQPASTSHIEAAALPMGALTALAAVRDTAKVQSGERVLVNGASSGVGVYTVQMLSALGAKVTAVCSGRNAELVTSLGALDVIDYEATDFTSTADRYDVVIDIVSTAPISRVRGILTDRGRLAVVGAIKKDRWVGIGRQMRAVAVSPFVSQQLRLVSAGRKREDLELIADMVDRGELQPVVGTVYDFDQAPDAVRHVRGGHASGKVVVTI